MEGKSLHSPTSQASLVVYQPSFSLVGEFVCAMVLFSLPSSYIHLTSFMDPVFTYGPFSLPCARSLSALIIIQFMFITVTVVHKYPIITHFHS